MPFFIFGLYLIKKEYLTTVYHDEKKKRRKIMYEIEQTKLVLCCKPVGSVYFSFAIKLLKTKNKMHC